jgi:hypothetical protein
MYYSSQPAHQQPGALCLRKVTGVSDTQTVSLASIERFRQQWTGCRSLLENHSDVMWPSWQEEEGIGTLSGRPT